jgi:uncharacterized membrane protein HdeD (DUF308 family)
VEGEAASAAPAKTEFEAMPQDGRNVRPLGRNAMWTLASGLVTMLLAVIAFLLPVIEWLPRGAIVGWVLLLAGLCEFALGCKRGADWMGIAAIGSGLVTACAGLLFVTHPLASYFSVAKVVMAWLIVRGAWMLLLAAGARRYGLATWLMVSGAVNLLLAAMLIINVPISALVVALFGPTADVVARFSLILAVSFLATGLSQVAIAVMQRRSERGIA